MVAGLGPAQPGPEQPLGRSLAANSLAAELHSWLQLPQRAQPVPRSSIPPTGAQEA